MREQLLEVNAVQNAAAASGGGHSGRGASAVLAIDSPSGKSVPTGLP